MINDTYSIVLCGQVQMFPNVAKAQESWEKAKKAHAKEITREHQNDIMKKVI